VTTDVAVWREFVVSDYGISFKYPPETVLGTGGWLPGRTTVDGRKEAPLELHFRPTYSRQLIAGVSYEFSIRIVMLTDDAKLNPRSAKIHGWTSEPPVALYPFKPEMTQSLETAMEQLYLSAPTEWAERTSTTLDGRKGIWFAGWDTRLKDSKFFHEVAAFPLSNRKILMVQAVHFHVRSDEQLRQERDLFKAICDTVRVVRTLDSISTRPKIRASSRRLLRSARGS
jgi:hypothetical protein